MKKIFPFLFVILSCSLIAQENASIAHYRTDINRIGFNKDDTVKNGESGIYNYYLNPLPEWIGKRFFYAPYNNATDDYDFPSPPKFVYDKIQLTNDGYKITSKIFNGGSRIYIPGKKIKTVDEETSTTWFYQGWCPQTETGVLIIVSLNLDETYFSFYHEGEYCLMWAAEQIRE
tara:strand:- start:124 stop:645 length:522 start_codon:yes stop_codon:yes gene_type:complete